MTLLTELQSLLGPAHVLTGEAVEPYLIDWRRRYRGAALALARPGTTEETAAVVRACLQHGVPVVPQGGNTGMCGGATPDASGRALILSTARLNRVRQVDTGNDTITVEAGCVLTAVQQAAENAGRLFPLSLAAEGSCTIGGNLATNAGGTQVLRYGNTRELTLGLEVVTADGEIWNGLRGLRKDNTGYDLRDLYIGSEGTLGVITAATLKLFPRPVATCTALITVGGIEAGVDLLSRARAGFGASLTGFELMSAYCLRAVTRLFPQQRLPFEGAPAQAPWFALLELSDSESEQHARERFEAVLGRALEDGVARDAAIAASVSQGKALWQLRESIPLAEADLGKSVKHDVSIPISSAADFVRQTNALLQEQFPGVRHVIFGHLGDGNLHYNVARAEGQSEAELIAMQPRIYDVVHDSVMAYAGSISAEHGIGQMKRGELARYKSQVELDLMQRIKQALDPRGLFNPGKVL
jgi:FAD/FMN-containing dehydrogenase